MRIATWNVNSIRPRLPRFVPWLEQRRPDVLCLQETKVTDAAFDDLLGAELTRLGYAWAHHGQGQWNGVAILSRVGLDAVAAGLPGDPGFPDPATREARLVAATCGGVRVHSVYVPNGRTPDDPHYAYKLRWLDALGALVAGAGPDAVVCGDVNIAPTDADVFDPAAYVGQTHVTPDERATLAQVAEQTGGRAFTADTARQLERVYSDIRPEVGAEKKSTDVSSTFAGYAIVAAVLAAAAAISLGARWP